jgi:hypothetical protein
MSLRLQVFLHYKQQVTDKIDAFRDMIAALSDDASNDAKSSAGDKHETALSMMHLEQEKLNQKLAEFILQKNILDKIDIAIQSPKIGVGSLAQINELTVFISTALPKITINNQNIFAISPQSPLGQKLIGLEIGSKFDLNNKNYCVLKIYE